MATLLLASMGNIKAWTPQRAVIACAPIPNEDEPTRAAHVLRQKTLFSARTDKACVCWYTWI